MCDHSFLSASTPWHAVQGSCSTDRAVVRAAPLCRVVRSLWRQQSDGSAWQERHFSIKYPKREWSWLLNHQRSILEQALTQEFCLLDDRSRDGSDEITLASTIDLSHAHTHFQGDLRSSRCWASIVDQLYV